MGKENDANQAAGQAAQAQTRLAQQLVGETSPLRRSLINDANQFMVGGRDVTSLPEFGAAKSVMEPQFANARESIIASTPEGGGLTSALAELEGSRARSLTEITGALAGSEVDRATQLATFGTAQGSSGLGSAAAIQAQRAAAEAQSNAGKSGGLGSALGGGLGYLATKD